MKDPIRNLLLMFILLVLNSNPTCQAKYNLTNAANFVRQNDIPVNFKKTDNCILYPKVKQGNYPVIL